MIFFLNLSYCRFCACDWHIESVFALFGMKIYLHSSNRIRPHTFFAGARNTPNRGRRRQSAGVRKLEHEKGGQITLLFRASDGNRTRTDISAHGILSPACLPIPPPKLPLQAFRRPYWSFRPVCRIAKIVNIFVKTGKRF